MRWYWKAAIGFYAVIAIVTFGHAAEHADSEHRMCRQQTNQYCGVRDGFVKGTIAAVMWPLYWSWEAWSRD